MKEKKRVKKYKPKYVGTVNVSQFNFSKENYTKLYLYLYGMVLKDYHTRKDKIGFIMKDGKRKCIVKMKVRTAIGNLMMWKPYVDFGFQITIDDLYDTGQFNEKQYLDTLNKIYRKFYGKVPIEELSACLSHINDSFSTILIHFSDKIGNTLTSRDIVDLANESPEFNDILHTTYPDGTPFPFIEHDIAEKNKRVAEIMRNSTRSNFRPFISAGGNINMGQMAQMLVCIGPRIDLDGSVPPVIINSNFARGLKSPTEYYLESFTCKKSLVANNYQMSESGHTGRVIDINNADVCLDNSIKDCGTERTVKVFVKDKATLDRLNWKWIKTPKGYKMVDPEKDIKLIGTTVEMRSVVTCCAPVGHICEKCYGGIAYSINGYHSSILATHEISEPVGQKVLSTKHLIKSKVIKIVYSEEFEKYFKCTTDAIFFKNDGKYKTIELGFYVRDIEDYVDMLKGNKTQGEDDEDSVDTSDTMMSSVNNIFLRLDGVEYELEAGADLYFAQGVSTLLAKAQIDWEEQTVFLNVTGLVATEERLFEVNIQNMEISMFLNRMMKLIGIKSKTNHESIESFLEEFVTMINELELDVNIVHLESIIYSLVRDPDDILKRPDFNIPNVPYVIHPLYHANLNSRTLTASLAYARIPNQFKSVTTYRKKDKGLFDVFFE